MSKFCGNCGAQMDDAARVCGNCGTPFEGNQPLNTVTEKTPMDPVKKAKVKKIAILIAAAAGFIAIVIIAICIISGFVGYKGAVRKIMKAYEDYDINAIVDMSSDYYFCMANDDYADYYFSGVISEDLEAFENEVGHKYKLKYKITDSYDMSKHRLEDLLDNLSYYEDFDADMISEVKIVELDVTAKEGRDDMTIQLKLTLTKEDGSWKILYMQ